jgi:hypothetical protein
MAKLFALIGYAVLLLVCGWLTIASLSANQALPFSWRPDHLAFTFVPIVIFLMSVLAAQAVKPFLPVLLVQLVVTGSLLLAASLLHAYPAWSISLGALHLVCAIGFAIWNVVALFGSAA